MTDITPTVDAARRRSDTLVGYAAGLATIVIWAGWIVGTRHASRSLDLSTVGLLRYGVPALLLLPVWWRTGPIPRGVPRSALVALLLCGGAPFFLVIATGMSLAPAAEVGPLLPGTMPLFVALLSILVDGERLGPLRIAGFVLVACGVAAIVGPYLLASGGSLSAGHLLTLGGALSWAVYTLAFRRSRMSAFEAAAVVALWSGVMFVPTGVPGLAEALRDGRAAEVAVQAVLQGGLSGVVAIVLYGVAIGRLGPSRGAVLTALIPGLVAVLAIPVLGEWPGPSAIVGIAATSAGVVVASGVIGRRAPARL